MYTSTYICIQIQVARPGYMFPGDVCPGVNAAQLEKGYGKEVEGEGREGRGE